MLGTLLVGYAALGSDGKHCSTSNIDLQKRLSGKQISVKPLHVHLIKGPLKCTERQSTVRWLASRV